MTRVLQLTSSYPRNSQDNSSIFLRHLCRHLAKKRIEIHVLAPDDNLSNKEQLDEGIKVHWFRYFPSPYQKLAYGSGILPNLKSNKLLFLQVPFFVTALFFSLLKLAYRLKPDFIHAHWIFPQGFIAILIGCLLRIPVITTVHGGDAYALKSPLMTRLKLFTLKHSYKWTSNTNATAHSCTNNKNTQKPVVIPMGVDTEHFKKPSDMNFSFNENKRIILFVGRLVEKKGAKYLIEAFSLLSDEMQNQCTLWIIGDGEQRHDLEDLSKTLNINKSVRFFGSINNDKLTDYYASASVFVAPSIIDPSGDTEGQGVILLEAMSCHVPVVTTDTGGIPEIITNNLTGIIVPQKNASALSDAIQNILNNPNLADSLSSEGLRLVHDKYQWTIIANKFASLYDITTPK